VDAALKRGLAIDTFAPRISFFFGAYNDLLEEVAKFRAARRIWARLMKERYKAENPKSWKLRFHTQTCGCTLTAQQPENNIVRVTLQALAAVLGGTQSLHTNSFDEALALPTEKSSTIALRTQQLIACESGLKDVIDPLGGSYALETLTRRVESEVHELLDTIEAKGGAVACLKNGYMKSRIEESAYAYQKRIEAREEVVVGVNRFKMDDAPSIELLKVSEDLENARNKALEEFCMDRDASIIRDALTRLTESARKPENIMPALVEAVKADATLGEMCNALKEVFGVYDRPY
jgi:methylmalonyl-CoA mutase N-terminal domain/subunit